MNEKFDEMVQELQKLILEETRKQFGEKVYERWQRPWYMGALEDPDGHARVKGSCGDSMEIFLHFENDRVVNASFQTDGCGPTVVCGSYAAEMAFTKTPNQLFEITGASILKELDGLPPDHQHCAYLAADALQAAADDYMIKRAHGARTETDEGKQ